MRVALFVTCFNDTMFPATGQATVTVLERLGVDVHFPLGQTCCGQMHFNTGYRPECVPLVRGFVDTFASYDAIVSPSGSCTGMVRQFHHTIAASTGDPGLAREVSELVPRVHELSELLVDVLNVTDVGASFPRRVTYHPTCHSLRMLRVGDRPRLLLEQVRGLELLELPDADQCCGFGGTFALKNAEVSVAMGEDKVRNVEDTGADVLVAGDNSCLAHVGGLLSRRSSRVQVMHLAEVLARTDVVPA
jgi:L-lactate dehydrogenase complex protein LldE